MNGSFFLRKSFYLRENEELTYERPDVERRVLFLLCLPFLPPLPLELVVHIVKYITKSMYKCFMCNKYIEKGSQYSGHSLIVFCSRNCAYIK